MRESKEGRGEEGTLNVKIQIEQEWEKNLQFVYNLCMHDFNNGASKGKL